jgi:hypothetical protein
MSIFPRGSNSGVAPGQPTRLAGLLAGALLCALAACAGGISGSSAAAPPPVDCPSFAPPATRCYAGQAQTGAYYWIAVPQGWNGVLVVHAHGGPRLTAPEPDDPLEDLERFSAMLREGYAWAGSTYRRAGFGVRMAAEDTNELRRIFWEAFGRPRRTILHGQSWGANVAAKTAELYARDETGALLWDGVLLTNGVLAAGPRAYQFRADLRAVYQFYCRNHPRVDEEQYPLWQGLPDGAQMTPDDLSARVRECTGVGLPAAERSAEQQRNLQDILAVIGVREETLVSHLAWGTFQFQDLVGRLGGNPFDNSEKVYSGSSDDRALNAGVDRFRADPDAVARLNDDAGLSGALEAPTLTIHAKLDPTAFVWHEAAFRAQVKEAGRSDLLVQTFTDENNHSRLSSQGVMAGLNALMGWIDGSVRPSAVDVAEMCASLDGAHEGGCHFDPSYAPALPRN